MTHTHDWGSFEDFFTTAMAQPDTDWRQTHSHIGLTGTAVDGARAAADLIAVGEPLIEAWRFGILHTVDTYDSARRRGGTELAAQVFAEEPPPTGSIHVDAAFAALARHLADRDGWPQPAWTMRPERVSSGWYVAARPAIEAMIRAETPPIFREHGVFIAANDLDRA